MLTKVMKFCNVQTVASPQHTENSMSEEVICSPIPLPLCSSCVSYGSEGIESVCFLVEFNSLSDKNKNTTLTSLSCTPVELSCAPMLEPLIRSALEAMLSNSGMRNFRSKEMIKTLNFMKDGLEMVLMTELDHGKYVQDAESSCPECL